MLSVFFLLFCMPEMFVIFFKKPLGMNLVISTDSRGAIELLNTYQASVSPSRIMTFKLGMVGQTLI